MLDFLIIPIMIVFVSTYAIIAFQFAKRILINVTQSKIAYFTTVIMNSFFIMYTYFFDIPIHYLYLAFIILYFTEFMIVSESTVRQAVFGAMFFTMRFSTMNVLVIGLGTAIAGATPYELLHNKTSFSVIIIITYLLLIISIRLNWNAFDVEDVIRLSAEPKFSEMVSFTIFIIIAYTAFDAYMLFSDWYNIAIPIICLATAIMNNIFFIKLLKHSMEFVKVTLYKRKLDTMEVIYGRQQRKKEILQEQVRFDEMTGLYNKTFALEILEKSCNDYAGTFLFILADINGLKSVNDNFGHPSGDRYIRAVSKALKDTFRNEDIVARVGGDEFFVIAGGVDNEYVHILLNRLNINIQIQNEIEPEFEVSMCAGYKVVDEITAEKGYLELIEEVGKSLKADKSTYYSNKI